MTNSHRHCDHEATKAARAACRKLRAQNTTPITAAAAKAQAEIPPAPRRIAKIVWERVTCDRCAGSGRYPSAMWQGVCLKCSGKGEMLTRAGRAALDAWDAYLEANHTKMYIELEPGDIVVTDDGRRCTVVSVDDRIFHNGGARIGTEGTNSFIAYSSLVIKVQYRNSTLITGPYHRVHVHPRGEALQTAFRHVENRKGAIVTYVD